MTSLIDHISFHWEGWYPAALGVVAGVTAFALGPDLFAFLEAKGWKGGQLYDSVFDIACVTTPFLFTFYSFVVTTERGFIARARNSRYFRDCVRFTMWAIALGAILTVATVPMQIAEIKAVKGNEYTTVAFALWVALAVATFAAFYRAAHLFVIFAANHR